MNKLLNFLPLVFGFTQAAKPTPVAAPVPAVSDNQPNEAKPALAEPAALAGRVTAAIDTRHTWKKPVRDFQTEPHLTDGTDMGYRGHNVDQFNIGVISLRARFTKAVMDALHLLDWTILAVQGAINEVGEMSPIRKANLQLELDQLTAERTKWKSQLTMTVSDPESELAPCYELFRAGYELGMQRYHDDKRYGDANGLNNLIP